MIRRDNDAAFVGVGGAECPPAGSADEVRVAQIVDATDAEGPGRRTAVWVQGCTLHCKSCFNPHMWTSRGGRQINRSQLAGDIVNRALAAECEGITFLGGEPFEQAAALSEVALNIRDAGLSVMTFTGYTLTDLRRWASQRADIAGLLAATDLLADGPYLVDRPERSRPWVGSTNQRLHALTERYAGLLTSISSLPDRVEVRVGADGTVTVNGWAEADALDALLVDLRITHRPEHQGTRDGA